MAQQKEITRRDFLDYVLFTSLSAAALSALAPVPFYLVPPAGLGHEPKTPAKFKQADLREGESITLTHLGKPALVVRMDGKITALSAVCTHAQCTVEWKPDQKMIRCPCHGGAFNLQGAVLSGPPQSPLAALSFLAEGDDIVLGG